MVAKTKARKKRASRKELNADVLLELEALDVAVRRMLEAYEMRVTGRIAEMLQSIRGDGAAEAVPRPLTVQTAQAVLAELRGAELRPERGRSKDFARASELAKRVARLAAGD